VSMLQRGLEKETCDPSNSSVILYEETRYDFQCRQKSKADYGFLELPRRDLFLGKSSRSGEGLQPRLLRLRSPFRIRDSDCSTLVNLENLNKDCKLYFRCSYKANLFHFLIFSVQTTALSVNLGAEFKSNRSYSTSHNKESN
jgi:hypothetical protein